MCVCACVCVCVQSAYQKQIVWLSPFCLNKSDYPYKIDNQLSSETIKLGDKLVL